MRISLTAAEVQSWSSRSGLDVPSLAAAKATGLTADVYPNGNIGPVWAGAVMLVDGAALPCIQWYLHRHLWQYRTLDDVRELVGGTEPRSVPCFWTCSPRSSTDSTALWMMMAATSR